MPATSTDRLYGLTTSVAVKPAVYISADYNVTLYGEQTITSSTPTADRTVTTTEGMRILLLGQTNPVENGIWEARPSFWVRAPDFNGPRDVVDGTLVFNITGDCWQVEADDPVVIGRSAIHFRPTYPFEANLDIFQRTLRVPEASVNVLPSAEDRAWKGLGFDGAGQPKLQDPAGTGLWGYVPAIGSFEKGSLLTQRFEILLWESTDEYWRWDGAFPKVVPAGSTPATSGGVATGAWVSVGDAALRSLLASIAGAANVFARDGHNVQQLLDQVVPIDNISVLRTTEPAFSGAKAKVTSYHSSWTSDGVGPIGGGDFYHDASDTATADDGIFTFVTPGGARWKRQLSGVTLNLAMGGVRSGDDATAVLVAMVASIIARFTAATAPVASGTSPVFTGDLIDYGNTTIEVYPGIYVLTVTVQLPTVISLVTLGAVGWDARSITSGVGVFNISNDNFAVGFVPKYFQSGPVLNGAFGGHYILGSKTIPGAAVGNTGDGFVNCTGWLIHNTYFAYLTSSIEFIGAHDTYLCHFSNLNNYGMSVGRAVNFLRVAAYNSGERNTFTDCNFGGCDAGCIYVAQPGLMLAFTNCSADLTNGDILEMGSNGTNCSIDFINCHAEGFDGVLIRNNNSTTNRIKWDGGQILPTSRSRGASDNYMGRQLIAGELQGVQIVNTTIFNSYPPNDDSVYIGIPANKSTLRPFKATGIVSSLGLVPSMFDISNRGYDFSAETVGATLSGSSTTLTRFQKPDDVTYWIAGVTATVITNTDGTTALQIVPSTTGLTTNYIVLTTKDYLPVQGGKSKLALWLAGQVLLTSIRYRVAMSVKWYDSDKNLIATTSAGGVSDLYTNSQITVLPGYSSDQSINGARKLATYVNTNMAPPGAVYAKPVWTISGIDQTINVTTMASALLE